MSDNEQTSSKVASVVKKSRKAVSATILQATKGVSPDAVAKVVRKHRKPGVVAVQEVRKHQKSTRLLIRKLPFHRIIRKEAIGYSRNQEVRFQKSAFDLIQELTEDHLVRMYGAANVVASYNNRITVSQDDIRCAEKIYNMLR